MSAPNPFASMPQRVQVAVGLAATLAGGQAAIAIFGDPNSPDCCVAASPIRDEPPAPVPRPPLRVA